MHYDDDNYDFSRSVKKIRKSVDYTREQIIDALELMVSGKDPYTKFRYTSSRIKVIWLIVAEMLKYEGHST